MAPHRGLHVLQLQPRMDEAVVQQSAAVCVRVLVLSEHSSDRTPAGNIVLDLCHLLAGNHPNCPVPDTAVARGKYCFPAFCETSVREWPYFFESKKHQQNKNSRSSVLLLISVSVMLLLLALYLCSLLSCILSTRVICEDGNRGENTHRVSMSLLRRRNRHCVLSNPQQLGLLGIDVFSLTAL